MGLDRLPCALLQIILSKLDPQSICFASAACQTLYSCASQTLPQLQKLYLVDIPLSGRDLGKLLSANHALRSLTLDCSKLQDEDIELLAKPHLQELSLWKCRKLSHKLLVEIGRHCSNLRFLSLELGWPDDRQAVMIHRAALEQMLQGLCDLESLAVSMEGGQFDARVFSTLPRFVGPSLKALDIGCMTERDARQLVNVSWNGQIASVPGVRVVGCQNLQKLSVVLSQITDTLVTILTQNLLCLSELDLEDEPKEEPSLACDLSNWGVQQVGTCSKLRRLSLIRHKGRSEVCFKRVNDLGFLLLAQSCKGLESIRLGGFSQVTDAGLKDVLHSCSNLRTFHLVHMIQISDLTFHDLPATTLSLVSVSLTTAIYITSDSVVQLAYCKNLEFLNLGGCRSVGDDSLKAVSRLTKLTTLVLNGADISDIGLSILGKGSTPLVSLCLRGCKRLTDSGINILMEGHLPVTLEVLDLSNIPGITDHTIFTLISSKMQIKDLCVRECHRLTGASVAALASMQCNGKCYGGSLRSLDLWNNKGITASSLQWFKKPYFPRLRWLGLGWHLKNEASGTLVYKRPSVQISWRGCELDCGLDGGGGDL